MNVRAVMSMLSISCALLGACSEVHSPQVGDTNTSWLHRCESESDCGPGARCIAQLCTLPCEEASSHRCSQVSKASTCDLESQMCDMSCSADLECGALGTDFRCEAGRCRPLPELSLSEETLTIAATDDLGESLPFALGTQTIWLNDHFRIGTILGEEITNPQGSRSWESAFMVSDVFPDGRVERRLLRGNIRPGRTQPLDLVLSPPEFVLGQNGGVAVLLTESDPATIDAQQPDGSPPVTHCTQAFYGPDLTLVSTGTQPCEESLRPVNSDANGDWLMWGSRKAGGLGRYRPSERRWVDEPRSPAADERYTVASTQVRDGQLWLHAQSEWGASALANIPFTGSLSALALPETWQTLPTEVRMLRPMSHSAGWQRLSYRDGWLIPRELSPYVYQTESFVRAIPIDPGQSRQPVSFALEVEGKVQFGSLQPIPGRDLLAICYIDVTERDDGAHFAIKLSWFDTRGTAFGGALQLASEDGHNVPQCELTWSGSDLLATWVGGRGFYGLRGASYARRVRVR